MEAPRLEGESTLHGHLHRAGLWELWCFSQDGFSRIRGKVQHLLTFGVSFFKPLNSSLGPKASGDSESWAGSSATGRPSDAGREASACQPDQGAVNVQHRAQGTASSDGIRRWGGCLAAACLRNGPACRACSAVVNYKIGGKEVPVFYFTFAYLEGRGKGSTGRREELPQSGAGTSVHQGTVPPAVWARREATERSRDERPPGDRATSCAGSEGGHRAEPGRASTRGLSATSCGGSAGGVCRG